MFPEGLPTRRYGDIKIGDALDWIGDTPVIIRIGGQPIALRHAHMGNPDSECVRRLAKSGDGRG